MELSLEEKHLYSVWLLTHTHIPGGLHVGTVWIISWREAFVVSLVLNTLTHTRGVTCGDCMNYLLKRSICYQCSVKHTHIPGFCSKYLAILKTSWKIWRYRVFLKTCLFPTSIYWAAVLTDEILNRYWTPQLWTT